MRLRRCPPSSFRFEWYFALDHSSLRCEQHFPSRLSTPASRPASKCYSHSCSSSTAEQYGLGMRLRAKPTTLPVRLSCMACEALMIILWPSPTCRLHYCRSGAHTQMVRPVLEECIVHRLETTRSAAAPAVGALAPSRKVEERLLGTPARNTNSITYLSSCFRRFWSIQNIISLAE